MGRDKKDRGAGRTSEGSGSCDGTALAATTLTQTYASQQCGLCKQDVETEAEEHIAGFCTACKKIPLHTHCTIDFLERALKAEAKEGGHTSKGLKAVLLLASSRPHELIATDGRMPKWQCLRKCCVCREGEMVTAEVQKARKVAPALQPAAKPAAKPAVPPTPGPAAKRAAMAHRKQQASAGFVVQRREPVATGPSAAARLHGSSSASTFAAEQERLAREEKERQRQERQAARAARMQCKEREQRAGGDGCAAEGDHGGDERSPQWLIPAAQALPVFASTSSLGAATPQLSHATSTACSLPLPDDALPGYDALPSFSLGAALAAWSSSDVGAAAGDGSIAGEAAWGCSRATSAASVGTEGGAAALTVGLASQTEVLPAAVFDTKAANEPESVFWLPPQFDREEAPDAEVDELMRIMGLG